MTYPATLAQLFTDAAAAFGNAEAVRHKEGGAWRPLSYAEMERRVARAAEGLAQLGVRPGDRVALLSENRPEWTIADYAILCLGAINVPIYATLPASQVEVIVRDARPRVLIASSAAQVAKLAGLHEPWLETLVCIEGAAPDARNMEWRALLERGDREDAVARLHERAVNVRAEDVASIIYTSGTTGTPKGAMLTHANLCYMVRATDQHGSLPLEPGDVALSLLPLSHVLERAIEYCYWRAGVTSAYAESIERAPANMREVRPHFLASVPRLFEKTYARVKGATGVMLALVNWAERVGGAVVDARIAGRAVPAALRAQYAIADRIVFAKLRRAMGGRMKAFISGGAPLAEDVARLFLAARLTVYEGYGLSETSPVLAANAPGRIRLGTVGVAYPDVELKVAESGEILARSPGVMKGYWNAPETGAIAADGWFHTGDIGHLDGDGFLWITDRLKDLVVTAGGKNIAPQPIEAHAAASPYVSQAVLIGDRRPYTVLLVTLDWPVVRAWAEGEKLQVLTAEHASQNPAVIELIERETLHRLEHLASYERPKKIAILPEEFTVDSGLLTPTLKVRRRAVEQRYADVIEALYR